MAQTVTLTEADRGAVRAVVAGTEVLVRLDETPSTGYRWALESSPAEAAEVLGSRWIAPAGGAVGGAGKREFQLKMKAAGEVDLRLKLWREWQGEGSVIARNEFTLHVTT